MSAERPRYRAFISYSHRDKAVAQWLHRAIEGYRVPSKLVGRVTAVGPTPRRLAPVFRDRDELPASGDLGGELTAALERSLFLVVICSPAAAASRWVGEEVLTFKRMHGEGRVLALIASGEPGASADPARAELECFPAALRLRIGDAGALSDIPAEPIAADLRPGGDGRRLARLKLVAGLTGLGLDDLAQRDAQRRTRRLAILATASTTAALGTGALALYANTQRIEAESQRTEAERQRNVARQETATARAASDFLIDTFRVAHPAKQNPRTISAVDILENSAKRAKRELADQPVVHARLLETLGYAYIRLGLHADAREALGSSAAVFSKAGTAGVQATLVLAQAAYDGGQFEEGLAAIAAARAQLGPNDRANPRLRGFAAFNEGLIRVAQGETAQGVAAFDRAMAYYERAPDTRPLDVAVLLNNRGIALSEIGRFDNADRDLRRSLALNRQVRGEDDLETAFSWFALGANSAAAQNYPAAERQIARAIAIERRVLDPDNPILANALSLYGEVLRNLRRLPQARASLRQAITIYQTVYQRPHYLIGASNVYLGQVERDAGRIGPALAAFDEARRNYDASYDGIHPNHGELLVMRATALARAGRRTQATRDCAEGVAILNRTIGRDAAFTRRTAQLCADLKAAAR